MKYASHLFASKDTGHHPVLAQAIQRVLKVVGNNMLKVASLKDAYGSMKSVCDSV